LPLVGDLTGQDRRAAANAFRAFGLKLDRLGRLAQARQFKAKAEELSANSANSHWNSGSAANSGSE
jgi:hypothetical protein